MNKESNVIYTEQLDFRVLQHIKGAMEFSLEHSFLDAYFFERDLYKEKLSSLVQ